MRGSTHAPRGARHPWATTTLLVSLVVTWGSAHATWRQTVSPNIVFSAALAGGGDAILGGFNASTKAFAVVRLAGSDGAPLWEFSDRSPGVAPDQANAVAIDGAGNVFATGLYQANFAAFKISGANGSELWRHAVSTTGFDTAGLDLAIHPSGDAIAAGEALVTGQGHEVVVVRLATSTGMETWRYETAEAGTNAAYAVAVDSAGDVIVGATVDSNGVVIKLAGPTGSELWRTALGSGQVFDLVVDAGGDVVAVGHIDGAFAVAKLDGAAGTETWQADINGDGGPVPDSDSARAVTLDSAGDVLAAGHLFSNNDADHGFTVVKLAGASGSEVWRRVLDSPGIGGSPEFAEHVAVDAADDVITGGALGAGAIVKLAGGTGAELWRHVGMVEDASTSTLVTAAGDVVATGGTLAVRLSAADGVVGPIVGASLRVKDRSGNPAKRSIVAILRDPSIKTPLVGSGGDPTVAGAVLRINNPNTLESAAFTLPGGSAWRPLGSPPGALGYRYDDPGGASGPCKRVRVGPGGGGLLTASCSGRLGAIPFSLDEAMQGTLRLSLELGNAEPQCATFGGTVRKDAGTSNPGPGARFVAHGAPATFGRCP